MPIPILRTTLHRPPIDGAHLHRDHYWNRLNKGRHRPLNLVSAPAGYGKSTLVSCWLEACDLPGAWVSLDENDNAIELFLSYFVSAILPIFPAAGAETLSIALYYPKTAMEGSAC
jgi:LuxR family maltose regulon positive regulatory protein